MDEQQLQQQIVQLVQAAMQGDQQATQQIQQIMQAAQQGDKQAAQIAQMIQQVARQMQQQQVQAARFGAKLNYIKQLKGQCPEGYKMEYYKQGGQLCKKCMKVHLDGGEVKQTPNTVAGQFKMEASKRMNKKENGGTVESKKCGGKPKLKKKACGGTVKKAQEGDKIPANFADRVNSSDNNMGLKWRPLQNGKGAIATHYGVHESGTPYSTTAIYTPNNDLFMFSPGDRDYPNDLYDGRNISDFNKVITPEQAKVAMRELLRPAPVSSSIPGYLSNNPARIK